LPLVATWRPDQFDQIGEDVSAIVQLLLACSISASDEPYPP
jgi:hypothetical protein